jgi:DNA-binding GntR family transcriptional regulator
MSGEIVKASPKGATPKEKSLTDVAYAAIKAEILNGSLRPNRVVSVNSLVLSHGMRLGPIRAALHRLCGEDLVEALPQHGYRIRPLTLKEVVQLYDVMAILLPATARLAAHNLHTREHCEQMASLNARCNTARAPANAEEEKAIIEAGRAVSRIIAESADNRILLAILVGLFHQVDRVLHIWRDHSKHPIDFRRDYSAVIAAFRRGDPEAAAQATAIMVDASKNHVMEGILSQAEFTERNLF